MKCIVGSNVEYWNDVKKFLLTCPTSGVAHNNGQIIGSDSQDVEMPPQLPWAPRPEKPRWITNPLDLFAELPKEGAAIHIPHYYRFGDALVPWLIDNCRKAGLKGVHLIATALFTPAKIILEAVKDGTFASIKGNLYGDLRQAVAKGEFPFPVVFQSLGGAIAAISTGRVKVDLSLMPLPAVDEAGNGSGVEGPRFESYCGPMSQALTGAYWAKRTAIVYEAKLSKLERPWINASRISHLVPIQNVGNNQLIQPPVESLSDELTRLKQILRQSIQAKINAYTLAVIQCLFETGQLLKAGAGFQIGMGSGQTFIQNFLDYIERNGIHLGYMIGGFGEPHFQALKDNLVDVLIHGQAFTATKAIMEMCRQDQRIKVQDFPQWYDPANPDWLCPTNDLVLLNTSTVGLNFDLDTVNSSEPTGGIVGGIGGHTQTARALCTVVALPSYGFNRHGGFPRVVEEVSIVVTPGKLVNVVITENGVSINQDALGLKLDVNWLKEVGVPVIPIELQRIYSDRTADVLDYKPDYTVPLRPVAIVLDEFGRYSGAIPQVRS